jgi:hypothetical protein
LIVMSMLPEASVLPSGLNATDVRQTVQDLVQRDTAILTAGPVNQTRIYRV